MAYQTYIVDVYLIREDGRDTHLGGGYYKATSQSEAEKMAAREHASYLHEESSQLGFHVDISDMGRYTFRPDFSDPFSASEASRNIKEGSTKTPS